MKINIILDNEDTEADPEIPWTATLRREGKPDETLILPGMGSTPEAALLDLLEMAREDGYPELILDECSESEDGTHEVTDGSCDQCGEKNLNPVEPLEVQG